MKNLTGKKFFPDEDERVKYTYKLGNLTLLTKDKNASSSNHSFSKKQKTYKQNEVGPPFYMTQKLLDKSEYTKWTKDEIDKRTEEFAKKLKELLVDPL